jgi:hypothetical protein
MTESSRLLKLGELLECGEFDAAKVIIDRMVAMRFDHVDELNSLIAKYPTFNYKHINRNKCPSDLKWTIGIVYISNNDQYKLNTIDNYFFVGYHTYVDQEYLYDFKINRSYFIMSKYVSNRRQIKQIIGSKLFIDELYDYCLTNKPSYYIDMAIKKENDTILIDILYQKQLVLSLELRGLVIKILSISPNRVIPDHPADEKCKFNMISVKYNNLILTSCHCPIDHWVRKGYCHTCITEVS